jgi:hypothetical protein
MKITKVVLALLLALAVVAPSQATVLPKPQAAPAETITLKASLGADHKLHFGPKVSKFQSHKQTTWWCYTPAGTCQVPFLGGCCCSFWNGFGWVQYCGNT